MDSLATFLSAFMAMKRLRSSISGDNLEDIFLFQRLSVTIQRFNVILLNIFSSDKTAGHSNVFSLGF